MREELLKIIVPTSGAHDHKGVQSGRIEDKRQCEQDSDPKQKSDDSDPWPDQHMMLWESSLKIGI